MAKPKISIRRCCINKVDLYEVRVECDGQFWTNKLFAEYHTAQKYADSLKTEWAK